jgi:perosamine synthetase
MPVHFAGHPCDMDAIAAIARRHSVAVVEDAAHAFPASYKGRPIGSISEATCFSFYATKTITTGEGGMVTTDNEQLAERMRMMSLHGISKDAWKRYSADGSWRYDIVHPGFKYNLTDIAAAIGRVQLTRRDEFRDARRRIAQRYDEALADCPEIRVPVVRGDVEHAWHLYVIQLDDARLSIDRGGFIEALKAQGIGTSVHFIPLHMHGYYQRRFGHPADAFPHATAAFRRTVSLPIYSRMTERDVDDVIASVKGIVARYRTPVGAGVSAAVRAAGGARA